MEPGTGSHGCSQWLSQCRPSREFTCFWLLGLLNNMAYVIMLASAEEISSGAVGMVYLCAILPTILVKTTGPYWFHLVSYSARMWAIAATMAIAYCVVAFGRTAGEQLVGVALVALQGGLGEFSVLSLCAHTSDSKCTLTAWSSGTGFAGIAGYAWMVVMHTWLGLGFRATLLVATVLPLAWLRIYARLGEQQQQISYLQLSSVEEGADDVTSLEQQAQHQHHQHQNQHEHNPQSSPRPRPQQQHQEQQQQQQRQRQQQHGTEHSDDSPSTTLLLQHATSTPSAHSCSQGNPKLARLQHTATATPLQRLRLTLALWPYMVPLFLVYFSEYAMQSGTWSAMGFPVESPSARAAFYSYANWCYQAGVFVSRSSGLLVQTGRRALWVMPLAQCALLLFFVLDAAVHFWYSYSLLLLCFTAGLLGGAVYVNAFTLIAREVEPQLVEFSLGAACVADSLGIALADAAAVLLQGCLYRVNGLTGAAFLC